MIKIPTSYNYISAFLTFDCNLKCSYCINRHGHLHHYKKMGLDDWIWGLNKIRTRSSLPLTLSGGEPTLHPDFYEIVNYINPAIPLDLLTNGEFNIETFMANIPPERFKRDSKYASIRLSYHTNYTKLNRLFSKVIELQDAGYSVGVWGIDRGRMKNWLIKLYAKLLGIDFRIKEYLDSTHGHYKYPEGLDGKRKQCLCKPSEMLIAPDGRLFKCHHDLYHAVNSYGHILDNDVKLPVDFIPCDNYGLCNPCDLKLKYDRFQKKGHCSVEIKRG